MGKFWRLLKRQMKMSVKRIELYSRMFIYSFLLFGVPFGVILMTVNSGESGHMLSALVPAGLVTSFWMLLCFSESVFAIFASLYSTLFEEEIDWRVEEYLELRNLQKTVE